MFKNVCKLARNYVLVSLRFLYIVSASFQTITGRSVVTVSATRLPTNNTNCKHSELIKALRYKTEETF